MPDSEAVAQEAKARAEHTAKCLQSFNTIAKELQSLAREDRLRILKSLLVLEGGHA